MWTPLYLPQVSFFVSSYNSNMPAPSLSPLATLLQLQKPGRSANAMDTWFLNQGPFREYAAYGRLFQKNEVNPYGIHAFLDVLYAHRTASEKQTINMFNLLAGRSLLTVGWLPLKATEHDARRTATLDWMHAVCLPYYQGAQQGNHHQAWWSQLMQWCQEHPWLHDGLASRDLQVYSDRTSFGKLLATQKEPGPLLLLRWAETEVALQDEKTCPTQGYHLRHVSRMLSSAYPDAAQRMRCALTVMDHSTPMLASAVLRAPDAHATLALPQLENPVPTLEMGA